MYIQYTQYFHLIVTALVSVVGKEQNYDDYDTKIIVYCATSLFIVHITRKKIKNYFLLLDFAFFAVGHFVFIRSWRVT